MGHYPLAGARVQLHLIKGQGIARTRRRPRDFKRQAFSRPRIVFRHIEVRIDHPGRRFRQTAGFAVPQWTHAQPPDFAPRHLVGGAQRQGVRVRQRR